MVLGSWLVPVHSYDYWKWTLLSSLCTTNDDSAQKPTRLCMVSIAVADLCVGISVFPLLFLYEITRDCGYSRSLQEGMLIVRWLFQDASVVCLCSLVLERYIAIVKAYICPNDFRHMENNCYFYCS